MLGRLSKGAGKPAHLPHALIAAIGSAELHRQEWQAASSAA